MGCVNPVFIAAPKRCGTTMVTWLLHLHGLWLGECTKSQHQGTNYPVGTEHKAIKEYCRGLKSVNQDPQEFRREILDRVDSSVPWGLKTIHLLEMWQAFHEAFPDAMWLFPQRPVDEVVESRMRHPGMNGTSEEVAYRIVQTHFHLQNQIAMEANWGFMFPVGELARGNMDLAREVVERSGLEFDPEIARGWIDPECWHS